MDRTPQDAALEEKQFLQIPPFLCRPLKTCSGKNSMGGGVLDYKRKLSSLLPPAGAFTKAQSLLFLFTEMQVWIQPHVVCEFGGIHL